MWSGEVDYNWAREQNDLWLEEQLARAVRVTPETSPTRAEWA
jgi:hypothetical protein